MLATLPVKGRAPKTGYSRDQFGPAWSDVDHNGCDTRNDMLRRDLTAVALRPGTRDCVVLSGVLADPYTATAIDFRRGNATSTAVQIDHVVALSDAWQKGAQQLSPAQRLAFANDPLNLLAVDGPANQQQERRRRRHLAAAEQVLPLQLRRPPDFGEVQLRALGDPGRARRHGPGPRRTARTPWPRPTGRPPLQRRPRRPTRTSPPRPPRPGAARARAGAGTCAGTRCRVAYANCTAVRAAGAAPIHVGQPGYSRKLDRDGDGVGCE